MPPSHLAPSAPRFLVLMLVSEKPFLMQLCAMGCPLRMLLPPSGSCGICEANRRRSSSKSSAWVSTVKQGLLSLGFSAHWSLLCQEALLLKLEVQLLGVGLSVPCFPSRGPGAQRGVWRPTLSTVAGFSSHGATVISSMRPDCPAGGKESGLGAGCSLTCFSVSLPQGLCLAFSAAFM